MNDLFCEIHDYRYERKFLIENQSDSYVEAVLKSHPSVFSEIYHTRYVNNVYFDNISMGSYLANLKGSAQRSKVRLRWYGDLFGQIEQPVLEIKVKNGIVGGKLRYNLSSFELDKTVDLQGLREALLNSDLPRLVQLHLRSFSPVLLNRYKRKYFLSFDRVFRVTIDSEMEHHPIRLCRSLLSFKSRPPGNIVLELKYGVDDDVEARNIAPYLPFPITRHSKYVSGISQVYFNLP